jgi:[CysO sulfur-carrier protein]-S-L-cysteine hydrolase
VALREDQIHRYSRAILLPGVGGAGQEALLATGARLASGGPALLTAAAYLAAAGTPIDGPPGTVRATDAGFLVEAAEHGALGSMVLLSALGQANPDAVAAPARWGTVVALPDDCHGPRPLVAVGIRDRCWCIWGAGEEACHRCLAAAVQGAQPPDARPGAVQAGALVAMVFERLVLGVGPALSGMGIEPDGTLAALPPPACVHSRTLSKGVLAEALRHLQGCYPEEGCGVVLEGPGGQRWVALPNAYAAWAARDPDAFPRDARSAFVFEPAQWLAVLRDADARGERVACVVHAHPDGPAAFSAEDRAQAAPGGVPLVPGAAHLVVSVRSGRASAASWVTWDGKGFREAPHPLGE